MALLELNLAFLRLSQSVVDVNQPDASAIQASLRTFVDDVSSFMRVVAAARLDALPPLALLPSQVKAQLAALLDAARRHAFSLAPRPGVGFRDSPLFAACLALADALERLFAALSPLVRREHFAHHHAALCARLSQLDLAVETLSIAASLSSSASSISFYLNTMESYMECLYCASAIFRQSAHVVPLSCEALERFFRLHLHAHHVFRTAHRLRLALSGAACAADAPLSRELLDASASLRREAAACALLIGAPGGEMADAQLQQLVGLAAHSLAKHRENLLAGLTLPKYARAVEVLSGQVDVVCVQLQRLPDCVAALSTIPGVLVDLMQRLVAAALAVVRVCNLVVNSPEMSASVPLNNAVLSAASKMQHLLIQACSGATKRALSQQHGPPTLFVSSLLNALAYLASTLLLLSTIQSPP